MFDNKYGGFTTNYQSLQQKAAVSYWRPVLLAGLLSVVRPCKCFTSYYFLVAIPSNMSDLLWISPQTANVSAHWVLQIGSGHVSLTAPHFAFSCCILNTKSIMSPVHNHRS